MTLDVKRSGIRSWIALGSLMLTVAVVAAGAVTALHGESMKRAVSDSDITSRVALLETSLSAHSASCSERYRHIESELKDQAILLRQILAAMTIDLSFNQLLLHGMYRAPMPPPEPKQEARKLAVTMEKKPERITRDCFH